MTLRSLQFVLTKIVKNFLSVLKEPSLIVMKSKVLVLLAISFVLFIILLTYSWFPTTPGSGESPKDVKDSPAPIVPNVDTTNTGTHKGIDLVVLGMNKMSRIYKKDWALYFDKKDGFYQFEGIDDYRTNTYTRYLLRMVWKNMPWIRNIYIVLPQKLFPYDINLDHPNIEVVSHNDILDRNNLPTFNWRALAANVHKIKGLAENFVVFHDSMFPWRPIDLQTFVNSESGSRNLFVNVTNTDKLVDEEVSIHDLSKKVVMDRLLNSENKEMRDSIEKISFESRVPMFMSKDIVKEIHETFADEMDTVSQHRFRANTTFDMFQIYQYYMYIMGERSKADIAKFLNDHDLDKDHILDEKETQALSAKLDMRLLENVTINDMCKNETVTNQILSIIEKKAYKVELSTLNELIIEEYNSRTIESLSNIDTIDPHVVYLGSDIMLHNSPRLLTLLEGILRARVTEPSPYEVEGYHSKTFSDLTFALVVGGFVAFVFCFTMIMRLL